MKLDSQTAELPGLPPVPKKRGPKPTGKAKSSAQRVADFRARKAAEVDAARKLTRRVPLDGLARSLLLNLDDGSDVALGIAKSEWLEIGRRMGWKSA